jgi:hypothetical protein
MLKEEKQPRIDQIIRLSRMHPTCFFVINYRLRNDTKLETGFLRSQTKISILIVQKVVLIELSYRIHGLHRNEKSATRKKILRFARPKTNRHYP